MSTPAMMPALEHAKAALAGIPGLVSCEIGRKEDVSPNDYPMIQIVPTRVTPGAAYAGRTMPYYVIHAKADLDPGGAITELANASFENTIFTRNEGQ